MTHAQYGCGFSVGKDWTNFDSSPTLRLERLPVIGRFVWRLAGNRQPFPPEVRYGDICAGLPLAPNSQQGMFASHVLEHLSYTDFTDAIANTYKVLRPGGEFRLIVPDLEPRARKYVAGLDQGNGTACGEFMRGTLLGLEARPRTWLGRVRSAFGGHAHLWMWDQAAMFEHLAVAGFVNIRRCQLGDSADPAFAQVEERSRFISRDGPPELAVSAMKPREV